MLKMIDYINNKEWKGLNKFKLILSCCVVFVLPLIIANVPYMDDNTRLDNGYGYWEIEGRPVTTLLMKLLNFNIGKIYNIAPLPLIMGILFFSYIVFYITENNFTKKSTLNNILPFLFLICNPFFLQNLSYQYDVIGNIFSVSFILLSFFYSSEKKLKEVLLSALFVSLSCASYQPSTNIFIALLGINIIFKLRKTENVQKDFICLFLKYTIGICFYYILYFIGFSYFFVESSNRNRLIKIGDIIKSYIYSIEELKFLVSGLWKEPIGLLIVFGSLMLLLFVFYRIVKEIKKDGGDKFINVLLLLSSPFILLFSIWGPFILLKELFFNPRDFPVFGVFFFAFGYVLNINKLKYINFIYITSLILSILSFSYVYGNALNQDYMYKKYVYDSISMKLEDIKGEIGDKKIIIYGRQAMTSYEGMALQVHPFLSKILFPADTNFFKEYNIAARNVYNIQGGVVMDNLKEWEDICVNKIPPIVSNGNYDIFNFKDHVSVWFKSNPIFCKSYPTDVNSVFERKAILLK